MFPTQGEDLFIASKASRLVIKIWGALLFLITIVSFAGLVLFVLQNAADISLDLEVLLPVAAAIVWTFFTLVMQLVYVYHLFNLHRWTVLPSIILAFITSTFAYLSFKLPTTATLEVNGLFGVGIAALFIGIAILVWSNHRALLTHKYGRLLAILFVISVLPYLLYSVASLTVTDLAAVDDAGLVLPYEVIVQREENSHYYLPNLDDINSETKAELTTLLREARSVTRTEFTLSTSSKQFMKTQEFQNIVNQFLSAVERPLYQCPSSVNQYSYTTQPCSLSGLRDVGTLVSLEAGRLIERGDYSSAANHANAVLKYAHSLEQIQPSIIELLVARAVYNVAFESLERLGTALTADATATTTQAVAETVLRALQNYGPNSEALLNAHKREYMTRKESLQNPASIALEFEVSVQESYFWHPNRTIQAYADVTRQTLEHAAVVCGAREALSSQIDGYTLELQTNNLDIVKPNIMGRLFMSVTIGSLASLNDRECEITVRTNKLIEQYHDLESQ